MKGVKVLDVTGTVIRVEALSYTGTTEGQKPPRYGRRAVVECLLSRKRIVRERGWQMHDNTHQSYRLSQDRIERTVLTWSML